MTGLLLIVLGVMRLMYSLAAFLENCLLATSTMLRLSFVFPTVLATTSTLCTLGLFPGFLQ